MPRDLYKLMSELPKVQYAIRRDNQLAESWDRVTRVAREPRPKRDAAYEKKPAPLVEDARSQPVGAGQWQS